MWAMGSNLGLGGTSSPNVDTASTASASFAPPPSHTLDADANWHSADADQRSFPNSRSAPLNDMPEGFPVELAKVQPPTLGDSTIERPRLLDWLRTKTHGKVVLVLADAGYGKSTLLADFSRRSRLRTIWYRLDETDRDWLSLVRHIIAAGRQSLDEFGTETERLIRDVGGTSTSRETVVDTLLVEFSALAASGAVLTLDDFHNVDDASDPRWLVNQIVSRAPDRLCVVIASRRVPPIALAKLRSVGEIAELRTEDLRFDLGETTRLFNDTHGRNLAPDVLADLTRKTEGWAASLQMVQTALRNRSPAESRRFVRELSGGDQDLYEYLAEEVVGDLPEDLQQFLMASSVLQSVTPEMARVVTGMDSDTTRRLTADATRLTLLTRSPQAGGAHHRYHPLVRQFLEERLRKSAGQESVAAIHRCAAIAATPTDWRSAAHHYREAGDYQSMLAVVGDAIPDVMSNGQYELAESFVASAHTERRPQRVDLITSRVEMQQGDYQAAIRTTHSFLVAAEGEASDLDHALLNLVTLYLNYGDGERAIEFAEQLATSPDPNLAQIAKASISMVTGSERDDIERIKRQLRSMARSQRTTKPHHFAVTQYNIASICLAQDRPAETLDELGPALEVLEAGSAAIELAASRVLRAQALAMLGRVDEARAMVDIALADSAAYQEDEVAYGVAEVLDRFVDSDSGLAAFRALDVDRCATPAGRRIGSLSQARMLAMRGKGLEAAAALAGYPTGRPAHLGIEASLLFTRAYVALVSGDPATEAICSEAVDLARRQGAERWRRYSEVLLAVAGTSSDLSACVLKLGKDSPQTLTYLADVLAPRLADMDESAVEALASVAAIHPQRWRAELRSAIDARCQSALVCGEVLEEIGEKADVARLRRLAHEWKRRPRTTNLGRALARRVAERVFVEDQGRVAFQIGPRVVSGGDVRRKVLTLACFLLSRPQMSATRDQVLDALWPDLLPDVAVNSLNQTLYFLRRIFEPNYQDDLSPGYVHHSTDLIWLDSELISSRSIACRAFIGALPKEPSPDQVAHLADLYRGRFALDFEYEEWAGSYRDSLHASYLEVVERAVLDDLRTGHVDRGIHLARKVMEIDSSAESVEVALLRLYRMTGAHAAAAEQYTHYANVMRDDLGLEPPPLDSL
jgi:DNA-binding SARP family transcriptional activator/tetratricopeptide (TPR) repeat protein